MDLWQFKPLADIVNGQGRTVNKKCIKCNGNGFNTTKSNITITIPKGSPNGLQLRVADKGFPGKNGGKKGDLIITLHIINENNEYTKIDDNLIYTCNVKPSEILCGTSKIIKVFNEELSINIPELYDITQPIILPR